MINFPLSEEAAYLMTDSPQANRSHAPEPTVVRTPAAAREIAPHALPVNLQREEIVKPDQSATEEVYTCMKNACKGAVYDASHWQDLPGETPIDRASLVMCRGGRFPYLLLTFSIGFFAFFVAYRIVSSLLCGGNASSVGGYASPPAIHLSPMFAKGASSNVMVGPPLL